MEVQDVKPLHLAPGRDRRVLQGHRWVFANEIADRLGDFKPGGWVEVLSAKGFPLGVGYVNPRSLISVRLVFPAGVKPSEGLLHALVAKANERRSELLYPGSECYRAVYSESDGLPGLIVDRYGDVIVYQVNTLGMSLMEPTLLEIFKEVFRPRAIIARNDSPVRSLEGLPLEKGVVWGDAPAEIWVDLDGVELRVDPLSGQKTGLFLDQRDNRAALKRLVKGRRVLDLFCYGGAWALAAAAAGAESVTGVDQSKDAIAQATANAERNGLSDRSTFMADDVFHFLKSAPKGAFDVVIVDPPAFARNKAAVPDAMKGYVDVNRRAMHALEPGGLLVSSSCSQPITEELFREMLLQASKASSRRMRLLEARGQSLDHPALLAMPETRYLKCWFLEVV